MKVKSKMSFDTAFPDEEKKSRVFKFGYENFFSFVSEHLYHSEASLTEDLGDLNKTEKEEIYDRVISGCLLGISEGF